MHLAAAGHVEGIGALLGNMEGNVLQKLLLQALPQIPGGDKLAFLTGEGGIVDGKGHLDGGIGDFYKGQRLHQVGVAEGAADGDVCHAGQGHDLTGTGLLHRDLGQTVEGVQGNDLALCLVVGVVVVADGHLLVDLDGAPLDAAYGDAAHILVVVDGGDQQLQRRGFVTGGGIDILDDGFEQRGQILALLVRTVGGGALAAGAEDGGGIELLVGSVQVQQQLQHLVHDFVDTGIGLIDLVHGYDDLVAQLQGLLQHEAGLGHGALGSVYQQDNAVDHLQDPLYLAAKVGVARSIHNVDLVIFIVYGSVFCQNGDAPLPLQIAGVHDPIHSGLIFPIDAALLQHFVNQGGLTVVNVGDDGNISDFVLRCHKNAPSYLCILSTLNIKIYHNRRSIAIFFWFLQYKSSGNPDGGFRAC